MPSIEPAGTPIEINQDREFDEDWDGVGETLLVFWALGHGHDPDAFVRAVVDHCLEYDGGVPQIRPEDAPQEVWQRNVEHQDAIEYRRSSAPPEDGYDRKRSIPITVLDLERRTHGATKCSVDRCGEPWTSGATAQVCVDTRDGDTYYVRLWLCREHSRQFPEPSYRVCMVPVGATVMLPPKDGAA